MDSTVIYFFNETIRIEPEIDVLMLTIVPFHRHIYFEVKKYLDTIKTECKPYNSKKE
jgi:hypothetical protein